MPEPDFDQIAWRLIARVTSETAAHPVEKRVDADLLREFVEQLRLIWNARGAADIATVNGSLLRGDVPRLVDALRTIDR